METKEPVRRFPVIGMRNIKTACTVALCALVYYFLGRSPAFACIGAIFGMGSDMEDSRLNGGNRLFGTIIGGLLGMVLFWLWLWNCAGGVRLFKAGVDSDRCLVDSVGNPYPLVVVW